MDLVTNFKKMKWCRCLIIHSSAQRYDLMQSKKKKQTELKSLRSHIKNIGQKIMWRLIYMPEFYSAVQPA